jgi:hypothetical protein
MWNGFWGPSFGADQDALAFHFAAITYSKNLKLDDFVIGHIYSYALGVIYFITTDSLFIGSILSTLVWVMSAFILLKTMILLSVTKKNKFRAMLIYAFLPSSILLTSITLRESYQLLFVNLIFYSAIKIILEGRNIYWFILLFSIIGMGILHGALLAFGLFVAVAVVVVILFKNDKKSSFKKIILIAPLVIMIIICGVYFFTNFAYKLDNGLAVAVESYQAGELSTFSRATYVNSAKHIDGIIDLIIYLPVFLFNYLFQPMPWRVSSVIDMGSLIENILRAWLIWKAVIGLRNISTQLRGSAVFVFLSYLAIESIWSIGTTNWGTAIRHHIPSIGLLIISAFMCSNKSSIQIHKNI